uniref:Translocon-associated protein subunit alpha n=1 Tax=Lutzomyia longipalpis TaxID=7200 RepID=A0A1B0F040_LUTLO
MKYILLVALLVLPAVLFTVDSGNKLMTWAEDEIEDEVVDVEGEDAAVVGEDVEETDEGDSTASPDADTYLCLRNPPTSGGINLNCQLGIPLTSSWGTEDFVVETVEASFRYPMDFNYFIQNFSAIAYNRDVKPKSEATVLYTFIPSEHFGGRPFGLNIALSYRDASGNQFSESVFNETVMIYEVDEGLDGETFFLYVFLAGIVVLLLVVGQQFLAGSVGKRKRGNVQRKTIETGTNSNDVDYDWLPEETLRALQKSPNSKLSPKKASSPKQNQQSPKQRKAK